MKNSLFVVTHIGSGANYFCSILNRNERIQIFNEILSFDHPSSLDKLFLNPHKISTTAAIYGAINYFNKDFSCKSLYSFCKFIYLIREPIVTLQNIMNYEKYHLGAFRYYSFRLRRMYEMARNTPGAILVNYQSLIDKKDLKPIEDYLYLKDKLNYIEFKENIPNKPIKEYKKLGQEVFEKYLYKFKNLDLKII